MNVGFIRVVENTRLYGDTYVMWFAAPEMLRGATPGQFVMLRCADLMAGGSESASAVDLADDPLLPRAMSYHRVRQGEDGAEFAILYDVVGRGTAWLARREPGDLVYAWGPLGKGYSLPRQGAGQNLLLVGGGIGIAPLLWLADEAAAKGHSVVLIDGARDARGVFPAELVPSEVEVVVTTQDGSEGRQGLVTDVLLDYYGWADQAYLCGPNPMFAAIADVLRAQEGSQRARRRKPVQALLESPMGCGIGICYGCAVFDRRGEPRLVCKDGPRFELRDVY
ncbi:MAG TPA: dihydroorotate dehydrogenase electron transfer subunit [Dehalococcoidia bacterium]